jgi:hypothetical protein
MQTFTELAGALGPEPFGEIPTSGRAYADLKPAKCCSTGRVSICCTA